MANKRLFYVFVLLAAALLWLSQQWTTPVKAVENCISLEGASGLYVPNRGMSEGTVNVPSSNLKVKVTANKNTAETQDSESVSISGFVSWTTPDLPDNGVVEDVVMIKEFANVAMGQQNWKVQHALAEGEWSRSSINVTNIEVCWTEQPPTETPTATSTTAPSATPTATSTSTGTPEPTSTTTATPIVTATPTATATPQVPTVTPTQTRAPSCGNGVYLNLNAFEANNSNQMPNRPEVQDWLYGNEYDEGRPWEARVNVNGTWSSHTEGPWMELWSLWDVAEWTNFSGGDSPLEFEVNAPSKAPYQAVVVSTWLWNRPNPQIPEGEWLAWPLQNAIEGDEFNPFRNCDDRIYAVGIQILEK